MTLRTFRGGGRTPPLLSSPRQARRDEEGDGGVVVTRPATELRRLVGKFALLLAFGYLLFLMAGVLRAVRGPALPVEAWPLFLLPGAAFVPAVVAAVRLHRTRDPERLKALWPRCALYAIAGVVLVVAATTAISAVGKAS